MFSKYFKMVSTLFIRSLVILYWNENEILKLLFSEWALALAPAALNNPSLIKISRVSTHVLVYQLGQNVEEIQLAVEQSICSESLISYFVCN